MIRRRKVKGKVEEELTGLDEMEKRIKNAFIEIGLNLSRIEKVKENYELQEKRVEREKPKRYEGLMEKYAQRIEGCDKAIEELRDREVDLKSSLEEINLLRMSLKKEKEIDFEGKIMEIKKRLDEIMSRVEIYEEFPPGQRPRPKGRGL